MTAINDLVEKACSPGIDVFLTALYDMARAMEDILSLEMFRVEFRMPAEPADVKETPETVSVSQVDVYALAREMESVLRELIVPETAPMAPAATPAKAPAILNVHTVTKELRERIERLQKETISLPAVYSNFYPSETIPAPVDRPFVGAHALAGDYTGPQPPATPPAGERRIVEKQVERSVFEKTVKRSSVESSEQSVMRSTNVVRELEDVYERLATSTVDVDREIKRSAVMELDKARTEAGSAAPSLEKGTAPRETATPAPVMAGRSVEVPAFRLKLKVSPPSEQAADNVRRLSEAMVLGANETAPVEKPAPGGMQGASPRVVVPPSLVAVAPPALVAVHHSLSIMNRYLSSAAGMAGAVGRIAEGGVPGGQALSGQAPLVQLMLDKASPASAPINMLVNAGESIMVPVPRPTLIEGVGGPALNLAVNVAATRAMERSGGQAMLNLAHGADSGLRAAMPAGKEAVSATVHGTTPDVTENNTTNRVSTFHNTFNITVTVRGGGEDGDLRELGKKIGRILSDEIKRYGGI
jgi:hypothetical protein